MQIETASDLAEEIANWLGVYGGCKHRPKCEESEEVPCAFDEQKPFCCRQGLVGNLEERIVNAVHNDEAIEAVFRMKHELSPESKQRALEGIEKIVKSK